MRELELAVTKKDGSLTWDNYEEIEEAVREVVAVYKGVVYTEDMVKEAKADRAALNKLASKINDTRKDLEKAWMAPFMDIKGKAAHLIGIIDGQVEEIDLALKEYEKQRKEQKEKEIRAYADNLTNGYTDETKAAFWNRFFTPKWLNATVKAKTWKEALADAVQTVNQELQILEALEVDEPVKDLAKGVYNKSLDLAAAMAKVKEANEIKRAVIDSREKPAIRQEPAAAAEPGIMEELAMLADVEPEKKGEKLLCIRCEKGRGDLVKRVQEMAEALGLKAWYELR